MTHQSISIARIERSTRLAAALWLALAAPALAMDAGNSGAAGPPLANEAVGNTGAATLSIPIEVPPGPGGFEPELALRYSSHAGDSPYGLGWALPIGEIRCTARFGVPDLDNCERWELDGQLLTKRPMGFNRFYEFVEQFREVYYDPSSDSWVVNTPDGIVRRYGQTANSRLHAGDDAQRPVVVWLLDEEVQPASGGGNVISFTYDRDPDDALDLDPDKGFAYLSEVSYASGKRRVRFEYEAMSMSMSESLLLFPLNFRGGLEQQIRHRLTEIHVESEVAGNFETFRRHLFEYSQPEDYSTYRLRLSKAHLFGSDCPSSISDPKSACASAPPQEFDYHDPNDVLIGSNGEDLSLWVKHVGGDYNPPQIAGAAFFPPNEERPFIPVDVPNRWGDINGDGLIDIVGARSDLVGVGGAGLNTGSGWETAANYNLSELRFESPVMNLTYTGSGDICNVTFEPTGEMRGVGFGYDGFTFVAGRPTSSWDRKPGYPPPDNASRFYLRGNFELVDLDGDRLADLVMSVWLGGLHILQNCDPNSPPGPLEIPGRMVSVVFRNNGEGWDPEPHPTLSQGLPAIRRPGRSRRRWGNPWRRRTL